MKLSVRLIPALVVLSLFASRDLAHAQALALQASAGPTLSDAGYSFAAGLNYSPTNRISLVFQYDHTHVSSRTSSDGRGTVTNFRGGTLSLGSVELRVSPFGRVRVAPYGLAGLTAGISRPNVNAVFPNRVTNSAGGMFLGGGVEIPVNDRIRAFADARVLVGAEGNDGMFGALPLRAGLSWSF